MDNILSHLEEADEVRKQPTIGLNPRTSPLGPDEQDIIPEGDDTDTWDDLVSEDLE